MIFVSNTVLAGVISADCWHLIGSACYGERVNVTDRV